MDTGKQCVVLVASYVFIVAINYISANLLKNELLLCTHIVDFASIVTNMHTNTTHMYAHKAQTLTCKHPLVHIHIASYVSKWLKDYGCSY